ncbi:histidinol-phosphate aminotransferase [Phellopilus nigrolimitatus]|nr:histidinol-phosphate aminotransferase [Phellopilus nigrolimitatus]
MPILGLAPASAPYYPPHFDIEAVIRPNILALHPYRCARDDYQDGLLLDANENALGHAILPASSSSSTPQKGPEEEDTDAPPDFLALDLHRYPDPAQLAIKARIAALRGLTADAGGAPLTERVFLGVGSDEAIDLLMRVCVAPGPGGGAILTTPPTYGMYAVCAQVNDVRVVQVPLDVAGGAFQLRLDAMKSAIDADPSIKLIFLCSPGNPSGTLIPLVDIQALLEYPGFKGIVVVDEAYIDFAPAGSSAAPLIDRYANLCVLQTLSKSFGLAAIRLGIALAQAPLIQVLTNTKAPYNISTPTAALALSALSPPSIARMSTHLSTLTTQRAALLRALSVLAPLGLGRALGGHHANFLMVPVLDRATGAPDNARSERVYRELAEREGVVVRFRGREHGCAGCLRITVGSEADNAVVVDKLKQVLGRI